MTFQHSLKPEIDKIFESGEINPDYDTPTVLAFFNKETGLDFTKVFEQYLTTTKIPKLVLDKQGKTLTHQYAL